MQMNCRCMRRRNPDLRLGNASNRLIPVRLQVKVGSAHVASSACFGLGSVSRDKFWNCFAVTSERTTTFTPYLCPCRAKPEPSPYQVTGCSNGFVLHQLHCGLELVILERNFCPWTVGTPAATLNRYSAQGRRLGCGERDHRTTQ